MSLAAVPASDDISRRVHRTRAALQEPKLNLLQAARELDRLCYQATQLEALVQISTEMNGDRNANAVERAAAMLAATAQMLGGLRSDLEGLSERMLDASGV